MAAEVDVRDGCRLDVSDKRIERTICVVVESISLRLTKPLRFCDYRISGNRTGVLESFINGQLSTDSDLGPPSRSVDSQELRSSLYHVRQTNRRVRRATQRSHIGPRRDGFTRWIVPSTFRFRDGLFDVRRGWACSEDLRYTDSTSSSHSDDQSRCNEFRPPGRYRMHALDSPSVCPGRCERNIGFYRERYRARGTSVFGQAQDCCGDRSAIGTRCLERVVRRLRRSHSRDGRAGLSSLLYAVEAKKCRWT
ncbi:Uncharacterised protein [Rhodococcus erythropolis]|nr:Uncharacterised protein [Rhodococcus erythropolis]